MSESSGLVFGLPAQNGNMGRYRYIIESGTGIRLLRAYQYAEGEGHCYCTGH